MKNTVKNGMCKWFDAKHGFGFILDNETGKEYFCHYSGIHGKGFKRLYENDRVTFEVEETPRGLTAVDVRKQKRVI